MKKIFLGCFALLCLGFFACSDDDNINSKPIHANSDDVFSGQYHSITLMASVYGEGITERGVCWSEDEFPTLEDYSQADSGKGAGSFEATIDGLTAGTVYYICSYATGGGVTSYGSPRRITTTAYLNTNITGTTPDLYSIRVLANVLDGLESLEITDRGVYYSLTDDPAVSGTKISADSTGKGNFGVLITGLDWNTPYYVQSYAVSSEGTIFSEVEPVATLEPTPALFLNALNTAGLRYGIVRNAAGEFVMHYSYDIDPADEAKCFINVTYIEPGGDRDAKHVKEAITFNADFTEAKWNKISNNGYDFEGMSRNLTTFSVIGGTGLSLDTPMVAADIYSMFVTEDDGGLGRCSELHTGQYHPSIDEVWTKGFTLLELNGGFNGLMTYYYGEWLCLEFAYSNGSPYIPITEDVAKFSFDGKYFWQDDETRRTEGWRDMEAFRKILFNPNGVIIFRVQKETRSVEDGGFNYYMISSDGEGWLNWYFRMPGEE